MPPWSKATTNRHSFGYCAERACRVRLGLIMRDEAIRWFDGRSNVDSMIVNETRGPIAEGDRPSLDQSQAGGTASCRSACKYVFDNWFRTPPSGRLAASATNMWVLANQPIALALP